MVKKVWQTDGRTDGRTDGQTENTICRAAWSQLKTSCNRTKILVRSWYGHRLWNDDNNDNADNSDNDINNCNDNDNDDDFVNDDGDSIIKVWWYTNTDQKDNYNNNNDNKMIFMI